MELEIKEEYIANKEKTNKMIEILKSHDIEMHIHGCGCCGSPSVTFKYKGETILDDIDDVCVYEEDYKNEIKNG